MVEDQLFFNELNKKKLLSSGIRNHLLLKILILKEKKENGF